MNLLKSLFIPLWMGGLSFVAYQSILELLQSPAHLSVWGTLLASSGGLLFITSLFVINQPRTTRDLGLWSGLIFLGAILVIYGVLTQPGSDLRALPFGGFCLLSWGLYLYWYSALKPSKKISLEVGKPLPPMTFQDLKGQPVHAETWRGQPTLLLFYRGNWCPLCMAQIKEIAAQYRELVASGVQIALISPQPAGHSEALAKKFEVPFQFLVDSGGQIAQELGIYHPKGLPTGMQILGYDSDTVLPTVVIADAKGQVLFWEVADNYRIRPEPRIFKEILEQQAVKP